MIILNQTLDLKTLTQSIIFQTIIGCLLLIVASQISIPIQPVPVTLQTMAVLYIGLTYRPIAALSATISYIGCSILGMPVFTNFQASPLAIIGPTGGYIVSFVVSAFFISIIMEKIKHTPLNMLIASIGGTIITFIMGVSWLATFIGPKPAITSGLIPFIIPGLAKALILVSLLKFIRKL